MSTTNNTTSNVKISALTPLSSIADGGKLKIPVSVQHTNTTGDPNWESYGLTANVLSSFLEKSLGILDNGSTKGIRSKIIDLQNSLLYLKWYFGDYKNGSEENITWQDWDQYLTTSGSKKTEEGLAISEPIRLEQGKLYILDQGENFEHFPTDISIMSKVSTREYTSGSGTSTEITYEHLPTHYIPVSGYGTPSSGSFVFFATEDMDVVISYHINVSTLAVKTYGAFVEIADKLLTINGELMKVLVEAIVKNKKDIDSLYEKTKSLGDIHVTSIDSDEFPSVQGEPMVVVANRAPDQGDNKTRGADVPNRIGQIWVNTKEGIAYIAVSLGFEGWKQITNA